MKLGITLCASKMYLKVLPQVVRRIVAAAGHKNGVVFIFVCDDSEASSKATNEILEMVPRDWQFISQGIRLNLDAAGEKYKVNSQLVIARLQGKAFEIARKEGCDQVWNVEADVLPPPDALRVMEWALTMPTDDGSPYYDVAMCTYPNGLFLGGHGDPMHPIAEDFQPEERLMPEDIKKEYDAFKEEEKEFISAKKTPSDEWMKKVADLMKRVRECPPDGNIFQILAKHGWRRRGWLEHAYPGVGRGAILPTDWIGTGCILISKRALALATFDGYTGEGTQDLFLCWKRWNPAGLRMTAITHTACDHVKHEIKDGEHTGNYLHYQAVHEQTGEQRGHLRVAIKPWIPL